jgi:thymidylate synthase (FAD)
MKIINANAQLMDMERLGLTPYQFMERIGRICYKSEDKITSESAAKFISALAKNQHTAMFEHAHLFVILSTVESVAIKAALNLEAESVKQANVMPMRSFFNITDTSFDSDNNSDFIISGSFRVWSQFIHWIANSTKFKALWGLQRALNSLYPELFPPCDNPDTNDECNGFIIYDKAEDFKNYVRTHRLCPYVKTNKLCHKEIDAILRKHIPHTVIFTCDRGVSHEFVRHRPASFAQESTRYCNYGADKFGKEITVIHPCFWGNKEDIEKDDKATMLYLIWRRSCQNAEAAYFELLDNGATPQQARDVLPNSVKTEIAITATENEWSHIINLRKIGTTGAPHPQMKEVMDIAYPQLIDISEGRLK